MLAVSPVSPNACASDNVVVPKESVGSVIVPKYTFPVVSSFVFHETFAVVLAIPDTEKPEIIGAIVSGIVGVMKLCSVDVAVLFAPSFDTTTK